MTKSKAQNKSKYQNPNDKTNGFGYLSFVICAYFGFCALIFGIE